MDEVASTQRLKDTMNELTGVMIRPDEEAYVFIDNTPQRKIFENLWQQMPVRDFTDLWGQRRFWAGRDMLARGDKPFSSGIGARVERESFSGSPATSDSRAEQRDAAPVSTRERLERTVNGLDPKTRSYIETGLAAIMPAQARNSRHVDLDQAAHDPQGFVNGYLAALPPEERAAFSRRMEEQMAEENAALLRMDVPEDPEMPQQNPSYESLAFSALLIGAEAGRVHEFLRQRGEDSTLAGNVAWTKQQEEEETQRAREAFLLRTILDESYRTIQAAALVFLDHELAKISQALQANTQQQQEVQSRIDTRQTEINTATAQQEQLSAAVQQAGIDVNTARAAVDTATVKLDQATAQEQAFASYLQSQQEQNATATAQIESQGLRDSAGNLILAQENADGTTTYWLATPDNNLGTPLDRLSPEQQQEVLDLVQKNPGMATDYYKYLESQSATTNTEQLRMTLSAQDQTSKAQTTLADANQYLAFTQNRQTELSTQLDTLQAQIKELEAAQTADNELLTKLKEEEQKLLEQKAQTEQLQNDIKSGKLTQEEIEQRMSQYDGWDQFKTDYIAAQDAQSTQDAAPRTGTSAAAAAIDSGIDMAGSFASASTGTTQAPAPAATPQEPAPLIQKQAALAATI